MEKERISAQVINLHTIKPIDKQAIINAAKKTGAIITCEEHTVLGGLGGAVCEVLSQFQPIPVSIIGIQNRFGESGEADELFKFFKLTPLDLVKTAREILTKKNKK